MTHIMRMKTMIQHLRSYWRKHFSYLSDYSESILRISQLVFTGITGGALVGVYTSHPVILYAVIGLLMYPVVLMVILLGFVWRGAL